MSKGKDSKGRRPWWLKPRSRNAPMPNTSWKLDVYEGPFSQSLPERGSGVTVTATLVGIPSRSPFRTFGSTLPDALRQLADKIDGK